MIDLDSNGAGVNGASLAAILAIDLKFRRRAWTKKAKRIKIAFEVSPLAKGAENAFPLGTVRSI